jgi:hypothetical protein
MRPPLDHRAVALMHAQHRHSAVEPRRRRTRRRVAAVVIAVARRRSVAEAV